MAMQSSLIPSPPSLVRPLPLPEPVQAPRLLIDPEVLAFLENRPPPEAPPCPGCEPIPAAELEGPRIGVVLPEPVHIFTPEITVFEPAKTTARQQALLDQRAARAAEPEPVAKRQKVLRPRCERASEIHRVEARKLWAWYRSVDGQQFTHLGDDSISECWTQLQGIKRNDVEANSEVYDRLLHIQTQYMSFTWRAKRL